MSKAYPQGTNWCFTLNHPRLTLPFDEQKMHYLVYQKEKGEKGTHHYQGYVQFKARQRMSAIKDIFREKTIHLEVARGTPEQNVAYCTKNDTRVDGPWEFGKMVKQGRRSDLAAVSQKIVEEKASVHDIALQHPTTYIRFHSGIEKLHYHAQMEAAQAFRSISVFVLHGIAGSGKTRLVYDLVDSMKVFKLNTSDQHVWFDGYEGQPVLLLDDYYGWIKYGELLTLLDGYPYRLAIKGGHTWAMWKVVVITSNKPMNQWYHEINDAFSRRISQVFYFPETKEDAISAIRSAIEKAGIPLKEAHNGSSTGSSESLDSSSNREQIPHILPID